MSKSSTKISADLEDEKYSFLFDVRRSIRYHHKRIRYYDKLHKISTLLAAFSGSATIITVLGKVGYFWIILFAAIVAVFSISDLVFGTNQKARLHEDLSRRFIELEKSIITAKSLSAKTIANFTAQRLDIEVNEPPPLKVLDSMCYNELLRAMGHDEDCFVKIRWYQRLLSNICDVSEHRIKVQSKTTK